MVVMERAGADNQDGSGGADFLCSAFGLRSASGGVRWIVVFIRCFYGPVGADSPPM